MHAVDKMSEETLGLFGPSSGLLSEAKFNEVKASPGEFAVCAKCYRRSRTIRDSSMSVARGDSPPRKEESSTITVEIPTTGPAPLQAEDTTAPAPTRVTLGVSEADHKEQLFSKADVVGLVQTMGSMDTRREAVMSVLGLENDALKRRVSALEAELSAAKAHTAALEGANSELLNSQNRLQEINSRALSLISELQTVRDRDMRRSLTDQRTVLVNAAVQTEELGLVVAPRPGRRLIPFDAITEPETLRRRIALAYTALESTLDFAGRPAAMSAALVALCMKHKRRDPGLPPRMARAIGTEIAVDASSRGVRSQNVMWTWEEIEEFNLKYRASKAQIIKLHQKQIMCSYHVWHARILDVYVTENPPLYLMKCTSSISAFRTDMRAAWEKYVDHPVYSKCFRRLQEGGKTLLLISGEDGCNEPSSSLYMSCSRSADMLSPDGRPSSLTAKQAIVNICGRFGEKKDVIHDLFSEYATALAAFDSLDSKLYGKLAVVHMDVGDLKNLLIHLCLNHSASTWPCISCTCPRKELHLLPYVPADVLLQTVEHRARHMQDPNCDHQVAKNTATKVHCSCLLPAARYQASLFPAYCPTHLQSHPKEIHAGIIKIAKNKTYGCVGFPLYRNIPLVLVIYGVFHMCQNIRTVMLTMFIHMAIVLGVQDMLQELVAMDHPGPNLPHFSIMKAGGSNWKKDFEMDAHLTPEEVVVLTKARERQEKDASDKRKKGLTGGEMKRFIGALPWLLKVLDVRDSDGELTNTSVKCREIISFAFGLWREAEEVILAVTWDHDRSNEAREKIHAWRNYIRDADLRRYILEESKYMGCTPVHEAVCHFSDKAKHVWDNYKIGIIIRPLWERQLTKRSRS